MLEQRTCLKDGKRIGRKKLGRILSEHSKISQRVKSDLLEQLFSNASYLWKWKTDVRRQWCQEDKAQVVHQIHPDQLCKLWLSIPSKNVVKDHRSSLGHKVTYKQRWWKLGNGQIRTDVKLWRKWRDNWNGVVGEKSQEFRPKGPTPICCSFTWLWMKRKENEKKEKARSFHSQLLAHM